MKKILITGGTGQIGIGLAAVAKTLGYTPILVGRSAINELLPSIREICPDWSAEIVSLDCYKETNKNALVSLAGTCDHWIHVGEPFEAKDKSLEFERARGIYRAAQEAGYVLDAIGNKKFIRIGSAPAEIAEQSVFDKLKGKNDHFAEDISLDKLTEPASAWNMPYFTLKKGLAELAKNAFTHDKISIVTVAPTAVIGPFSHKNTDEELLLKVVNREYPFNWVLPAVKYNFISWRNLSKGIFLCLEKGLPGESYQLGGENQYLDKVMKMIMLEANPKKEVKAISVSDQFIPSSLPLGVSSWGAKFFSLSGIKRPWFMNENLTGLISLMGDRSSEKAVKMLGFDAGNYDSITDAAKEMVAWYRITGKLTV